MGDRIVYVGPNRPVHYQEADLTNYISDFKANVLSNYPDLIMEMSDFEQHDLDPKFKANVKFRPKRRWWLIISLFPIHILASIFYLRTFDDYLDDLEYTGKIKPTDIQAKLKELNRDIKKVTSEFNDGLRKLTCNYVIDPVAEV